MKVTIDVTGDLEVFEKIKTFDKKIQKAIEDGLLATASITTSIAQKSILSKPKTGNIYKKLKRSYHQASAAGEAPANDTGRLVSSMRSALDETPLSASSIAGTAYATHLEYGTKSMSPRPFMRPAAEKAKPQGVKIISDEIDKILR
jgi:HK97 gp10 family phage protein